MSLILENAMSFSRITVAIQRRSAHLTVHNWLSAIIKTAEEDPKHFFYDFKSYEENPEASKYDWGRESDRPEVFDAYVARTVVCLRNAIVYLRDDKKMLALYGKIRAEYNEWVQSAILDCSLNPTGTLRSWFEKILYTLHKLKSVATVYEIDESLDMRLMDMGESAGFFARFNKKRARRTPKRMLKRVVQLPPGSSAKDAAAAWEVKKGSRQGY